MMMLRDWRTKHKATPKINTLNMKNISLSSEYVDDLDEEWRHLHTTLYETALSVFGKTVNKHPDSFNASSDILLPLLEKKRLARIKHMNNPSCETYAKLKDICKTTQRATRECMQRYWSNMSNRIQLCTEQNDLRGQYSGIKEALGPSARKSAPLLDRNGNIITDQAHQLDRCSYNSPSPIEMNIYKNGYCVTVTYNV